MGEEREDVDVHRCEMQLYTANSNLELILYECRIHVCSPAARTADVVRDFDIVTEDDR